MPLGRMGVPGPLQFSMRARLGALRRRVHHRTCNPLAHRLHRIPRRRTAAPTRLVLPLQVRLLKSGCQPNDLASGHDRATRLRQDRPSEFPRHLRCRGHGRWSARGCSSESSRRSASSASTTSTPQPGTATPSSTSPRSWPTGRDDWFLASKTGDRSGSEARASLERSLERMGVDHLDLIQLHNLVEEDEWQEAFSPQGAVAALFQARDEGLVGHVGVTGHGLRIARMHIRSLAEADFASVLLPYNHTVLSRSRATQPTSRNCSTSAASVRWRCRPSSPSLAAGWAPDHDGPRFSWYQPLDEGDALTRAVHYVLADDRVFLEHLVRRPPPARDLRGRGLGRRPSQRRCDGRRRTGQRCAAPVRRSRARAHLTQRSARVAHPGKGPSGTASRR